MLISGIHTLTLLDFPGHVACIVFTPGCNFRCGYCHNAEFVLPEEIKKIEHDFIPSEKFFNFLETRIGKLEGVVISGGEPTIHPDLPEFIRKIKELGFLVKLDTNGTNPEMLQKLIQENLVDYIAMDMKASPAKYAEFTCVKSDIQNLEKSRDLIIKSKVDHEFRTTYIKGWHTEEAVAEIAQWCTGARKYTLQNFRSQKTLDPSWGKYGSFTEKELKELKKIAGKFVDKVDVLS